MIKPMLASDFDETKLRFPLWAQPKIDGVRGVNLEGVLTGRSLKAHGNIHLALTFSEPEHKGMDGEFAVGGETDGDLCRNTTSALNTRMGQPDAIWHVFDFITTETIDLPYRTRYAALKTHLAHPEHGPKLARNVRLVPTKVCLNLDELLEFEDWCLDQGYEGVIIRDPDGLYKQGRSTTREGGLLRIKRFIEEDATVLAVVEGQANGNEAKINELGRTERSTHQENMTPNGMVGTLMCRLEKDVVDSKGNILFAKGLIFTVSAGNMDHSERVAYFNNPEQIIDKTIKFKMFPKGVKDKPRFPTFVAIRADSDKVD